ncbi:DUF5004 domain-containing protein [Fulvivirga ligni]|uniref:DUF5004 domain-containing protein n=1 Tax=Fulvivirga ligni TaxID=2904246 RepID=UPI001F36DF1A|nr:DUF5004 domain-containing protein [Fulvivirga ligni]UII19557.1 DUF5004 domain-containing protein [Fulvivirga ligni]
MKALIQVKRLCLFSLLSVSLWACSLNDDTQIAEEAEKSIDGTWQITAVTRNGQDITAGFDFTTFKIHFNPDYTYTIDNYVPFIVKGEGNWAVDDPLYPFNISFDETGKETVQTKLNYPVVDGERRLKLVFSPGCSSNVYEYTMKRSAE